MKAVWNGSWRCNCSGVRHKADNWAFKIYSRTSDISFNVSISIIHQNSHNNHTDRCSYVGRIRPGFQWRMRKCMLLKEIKTSVVHVCSKSSKFNFRLVMNWPTSWVPSQNKTLSARFGRFAGYHPMETLSWLSDFVSRFQSNFSGVVSLF